MMEETRGGDRSLPLPIASRSGQVALPAPSGFAWPPMFAFMSNPILHHQATPMLPLPVLPLDISQSAYQQTGELPSSSLRAERRQSAPGMVASTSDSLPVFKATNPSHMSCCAHCKSTQTSGCWRRGWTVTVLGSSEHVNLCNKCGLRYKHGRLPNAPTPPPTSSTQPNSKAGSTLHVPQQTCTEYPNPQQLLSLQQQLLGRRGLSSMACVPSLGGSTPEVHQKLEVPAIRTKPREVDSKGVVLRSAGGPSEGGGSLSEEEVPMKRPCSRTSRDAAMTLMELNGGAKSSARPAALLEDLSDDIGLDTGGPHLPLVPDARAAGSSDSDGTVGTRQTPSVPRGVIDSAPADVASSLPTMLNPAFLPPFGLFSSLPGIQSWYQAGIPSSLPPFPSFPPVQTAAPLLKGHQPKGVSQKDITVAPVESQQGLISHAVADWTVAQVQTWLLNLGAEDIVEIAAKQGIDGQALQSLYRTGGNSGDALHSLIREEFGAARLGHRLRLLEGLSELFSSSTEHNRQQAESSKHEGIKTFVAE